MLISVAEFCDRSRSNLEDLVGDLQERTGRYGDSEAVAWRSSLPRVAEVLSRTQLGAAHLAFHRQRGLELEYRLPASSSWTDAVLLGRGPHGPAALFLELKDWETAASNPGPRPGLLEHRGNLVLHPSEQVRGYVDYCRRFHSGVQDGDARVDGLVFLTRSADGSALRKAPHDALVADYPVFCASRIDLHDRLPEHIQSRIQAADERFAHAFAGGTYRQERSFVRGMSEVIRDPSRSPFVLLDHQRLGLERCLQAIEEAEAIGSTRSLVIVEGPPGSGKSVLAAQLWAELVQRQQGKKGRSSSTSTPPAINRSARSSTHRSCACDDQEYEMKTLGRTMSLSSLIMIATLQEGRPLKKGTGSHCVHGTDRGLGSWHHNAHCPQQRNCSARRVFHHSTCAAKWV